MSVCCECCVLSARDLCDGFVTRPEESCRLWRVVVCDLETSKTRRLKTAPELWKIQPKWVVTPGKQTNKQINKRLHLFLMYCAVVTTSNFLDTNIWLMKGSTCLLCARNIYKSGTNAAYRTWTSVSRWNNELINVDIPRHSTSGLSQEFHRGRTCSLPGASNVGFVAEKLAMGQGFLRPEVLRFSRLGSIFILLPWTLFTTSS